MTPKVFLLSILTPLALLLFATPQPAHADPPGTGWTLVFSDEFPGNTLNSQWATETDAYSDNCAGNQPDHKLEYLLPGNLTVANNMLTITAQRQNYTSPGGISYTWTSGLITTGHSCGTGGSNFQAIPGDYYEIYANIPGTLGAWPAEWTWSDEVDAFEYHPDNPQLLELTNHTGAGNGDYYTAPFNPSGSWHYYGVLLGATSVAYYLDGTQIYADNVGFQSTGANLIVNLSIADGYYHPAPPSNVNTITMQVGYVKVWRKVANNCGQSSPLQQRAKLEEGTRWAPLTGPQKACVPMARATK